MGKNSKIEWTHHTFNPWMGCTKVAAGCEHCYAEQDRLRRGQKLWGPTAPRLRTSTAYWKQPHAWNAEAMMEGRPRRVFCASLADVCEDRDELLPWRADLMRLIEITPMLDWLLLTKRPENFERFFGNRWASAWPRNVWAGASISNQADADRSLQHLINGAPAPVRFVSYEPATGLVNLRPFLMQQVASGPFASKLLRTIDWVIFGGESGHGARPCNIAWAYDVVRDCRELGVAPFIKQLGALPVSDNANIQDFPAHVREYAYGEGAASCRYKLNDKKGGDMEEWPEELRVREFPGAAVAA